MKKYLSGILCLSLIFAMAVPSFAKENDLELVYENAASYEISIPANSSIDKNTGEGSIEFAVTKAELESNTTIAISLSSDNYSGGKWNLVSERNANEKIPYTMFLEKYTYYPYCESNDFTVCRAAGEDEWVEDRGNEFINNNDYVALTHMSMEYELSIQVEDVEKIGRFVDTLTFTSEIVDTTLSGRWRFNDVLKYGNFGGDIEFYMAWHDYENNTDEERYVYRIDVEINDEMQDVMYYAQAPYNIDYLYWLGEFHRVQDIDLGEEPQTVSPTLYEWFIKNAVKIG